MILDIFIIITAVVIIALILLQQRGVGLGGAFGGSGEFFATRRGLEKAFFTATVVSATLFILLSIARMRI